MTCPRTDAALAALHAGEPVEPDCRECGAALEDERRFVEAVERGLSSMGARRSIAAAFRRRIRRRALRRWLAAGAALAAASILLVLGPRPDPPSVVPVAAVPEDPVAPVRIVPPIEPASDLPIPHVPTPVVPPAPSRSEDPVPPSPSAPPAEPELPVPSSAPGPTLPEERRPGIAVAVKSGEILEGGRRISGSAQVEPSTELRCDRRTRVRVREVWIDFEAGSRFRLECASMLAVCLTLGEMLVEAPAADAPELRLNTTIRPKATAGRFVAAAAPDRVCLFEGVAEGGLVEGGEYRLSPAAAPVAESRPVLAERWKARRPRETPIWRLGFERGKVPQGVGYFGSIHEERMRSRGIPADDEYAKYGAAIAVHLAGVPTLVPRETTCVRFRIQLIRPGPVTFQLEGLTDGELREVKLEGLPAGPWLTMTLPLQELPVIRRGARAPATNPDPSFRWLFGTRDPDRELSFWVDDVGFVDLRR